MKSPLKRRKDAVREDRIENEIVVDAYDEEERAMSWYYHLEGQLQFPFRAKCTSPVKTSPLEKGEEVEVYEMAPEEYCLHAIFVMARWQHRKLAVPLSQLTPIEAGEETNEAVSDWHYWIARDYNF